MIFLGRRSIAESLIVTGNILAQQSPAALIFADQETAEQILNVCESDPHIVYASLYRDFADHIGEAGEVASYFATGTQAPDVRFDAAFEKPLFDGLYVSLKVRVFELESIRPLGYLRLIRDLKDVRQRQERYAGLIGFTLLVSTLLAMYIATTIQKALTRPIQNLIEASEKVSHEEDYSIRVAVGESGELGILGRAFNRMLARIEDTVESLQESEERFRLLLDQSPYEIFVYDLAANIKEVNQTACDSLGYTREELLGMTAMDIHLGVDTESSERTISKIQQLKTLVVERTRRRKNGGELSVKATPGAGTTFIIRLPVVRRGHLAAK